MTDLLTPGGVTSIEFLTKVSLLYQILLPENYRNDRNLGKLSNLSNLILFVSAIATDVTRTI